MSRKFKTNKKMKKIKLLFLSTLLVFASCSKPSYCECNDIASEVISAHVGLKSDVDLDAAEDCAEKVRELLDFNMPADKISMSYINQVSNEICNHGYYEGKGSNNRGKKYYP
jgi:hypothetical protein